MSYTTEAIIARGDGWALTSYGNGDAYALDNPSRGVSMFVQGDDANAFRDEYAALEHERPEAPQGYILAALYGRYH